MYNVDELPQDVRDAMERQKQAAQTMEVDTAAAEQRQAASAQRERENELAVEQQQRKIQKNIPASGAGMRANPVAGYGKNMDEFLASLEPKQEESSKSEPEKRASFWQRLFGRNK